MQQFTFDVSAEEIVEDGQFVRLLNARPVSSHKQGRLLRPTGDD
jgi:hypothetical protein